MQKIKVKPLGVNKAWQGRRFKTHDYKAFEEEMLYTLPKLKVPTGKLFLRLEFGFSNKASDIDGPTKLVIDCLSKKYGFNDNAIYLLEVYKEITKKGEEYIAFDLSPLE
jgi:hypothetical protein